MQNESAARPLCPDYADFPAIPLYKDQVVSFLSEALAPFDGGEEMAVTAARINNYVKLKVIAPPEKKKYSREQLICLYVVFLLKQVLSMEEIRALLQEEFPPDQAETSYRWLCVQLDRAVRDGPEGLGALDEGHPLLDAALRSFLYRRQAALLLRRRAEVSPPSQLE